MSEYTPTTNEVRGLATSLWEGKPLTTEEFDRWLASVKAEAWDERHKMDPCVIGVAKNPYREEPK